MTDETTGQAQPAPVDDTDVPQAIPNPPGIEEPKADEEAAGEPQGDASEQEEKPEEKSEAEDASEPKDDAGEEADEDEEHDQRRKSESGLKRLKRQLAAERAANASLRSRLADDSAAINDEVIREIGPPPKEEDFKGDYLAFERAQTAYATDYRLTARELRKEAVKAKEQHDAAQREAWEDHLDRVAEFRKFAPDYDQIVAGCKTPVSKEVASAILESSESQRISYYLAKNESKIRSLNEMSERQVLREIGRIEATLPRIQAKTETQAKKPVEPVKGSAPPPFDPYRQKDFDMDRYIKWRNSGGK